MTQTSTLATIGAWLLQHARPVPGLVHIKSIVRGVETSRWFFRSRRLFHAPRRDLRRGGALYRSVPWLQIGLKD